MNRHQRRALASKSKSSLGLATGKLEEAVGALKSLQGLGELPAQMVEAQQLMVEAHGMVSALVEDYQVVADELEALKRLTFNSTPGGEEAFARILAEIQAQRSTPGSA